MLLTTVSCSEYNKLLKSGSNKQKYDKALEYFNAGKYSRSLTLFKDIEHIFSQSDQADTVAFYTSLCSYKMGDFETSSQQFDEFRRRFGRSPFLEESEYYFAKGFCRRNPPTITRSRSRPCRPSAHIWIGTPPEKKGTSCSKT